MNRDTKEETWIPYSYWMDCIPGLGSRTIGKLLGQKGGPAEVYQMTQEELQRCREQGMITQAQLQSFQRAKQCVEVEKNYLKLRQHNIQCIPYRSRQYPKRLETLAQPPLNLYVLGRLPNENIPTVGIVGARLCSDYGRYMARKFGAGLAEAGIQVISGMAAGVDGISQKAAMDAGGSSFGILGCGVDICYPQENMPLYRELQEKGGIISEYIPGTRPRAGLFPMRNRIISGLSDLLLVVEARQKSGTLITVDLALEQGKEVYALPGRVTDALSAGCNRLIGQGAGIALSPDGIAAAVWELWERTGGVPITTGRPAPLTDGRLKQLSREEQLIFSKLSECGITVDELFQSMGCGQEKLTVSEIYSCLMRLCVRQLAYMEHGRFYRKEGD